MNSEERQADFIAAIKQAHGYSPFPWQGRLIGHLASRKWPRVIDVPTGGGKTSCIDIALYQLSWAPAEHPRRIFLVVDRRIIVDQASDHAKVLQRALYEADHGPARAWADRLRALFGGDEADMPFEVAVLRGGIPQEKDWAKSPGRPAVVLSTVDQVGSRLLFRGYGVTDTMAPIHAGLVGNDALFLLDEVHLSNPFAELLTAIKQHWRGADGQNRFEVVRMSATPGEQGTEEGVFSIDVRDRSHPVLRQRLMASKPVTLREVHTSGDEDHRRSLLAKAAVEAACKQLADGHKTVLIVVNRVDSAREAYALLQHETTASILLTGRMRPMDRDASLQPILAQIKNGHLRSMDRPSLVVVATQCVEAGADFDFDALVTECASLDALRQRFGRLDRNGEYQRAAATILIRKDQLSEKNVDPIYGTALRLTWEHLQGLQDIDFGIDAFVVPAGDELLAPKLHAPILLPAHLDAWAQTAPQPVVEPDIALWLHGPKQGPADVQIVWRADLCEEQLQSAAKKTNKAERQRALSQMVCCPPTSPETLSVPIYAVRAWLKGDANVAVSDVEGNAAPEPDSSQESDGEDTLVLVWRGDKSTVVGAREIRPGETLLVPATRGGLKNGCWDPSATNPVKDLGELAFFRARGRAMLRLHSAVLQDWQDDGETPTFPKPLQEAEDRNLGVEIAAFLDAFETRTTQLRNAELLSALRQDLRFYIHNDDTLVLYERSPEKTRVTSTDDGASFIAKRHTLAAHLGAVGERARRFAEDLGLGPELVADLAMAGRLHDVGKIDPRFQRWLVDGSEIARLALKQPLAKSSRGSADKLSWRETRKRAGYPAGARHEMLSVSLVQSNDDVLGQANDRDLVLHLIASHHGHCRPFAPAVTDPDDFEVTYRVAEGEMRSTLRHQLARLDSGVSDRFWALTERYGWWGLAWFESIVRLADHRASEERPHE